MQTKQPLAAPVKKQNFSRKRQAILEAIRSTTIHPTAEWVHQTLKPEYPDLSLGTVYRNINYFKSQGMIISVGTFNGQEHLDGNISPHSHFICKTCGAIIDIMEDLANQGANQYVSQKYELNVDFQEVIFYGTCSKCKSVS